MMTLPFAARQRLARPLRNAPELRRPDRKYHTLPIAPLIWQRYRQSLVVTLEELTRLITPPRGDFATIASWAQQLLDVRERSFSLLLGLEPFAPFESSAANDLIRLIDEAIAAAADALEDPNSEGWSPCELHTSISWWAERNATDAADTILNVAFGLPMCPVDDRKEFRAEWVLQHYAYNNGELLKRIFPHLDSLGIPGITDILVAISIIGRLLVADDQVAAYVAMDTYIGYYLNAPPETAAKVIAHLESREPALRRAQQAANRAYNEMTSSSANTESQALALVDMYKRTVEGPFRQYSWALHCLERGKWEPTPMLGNLRERLVTAGGFLAKVALMVVLPDLRNSETHETLEWDGPSEEFVTETSRHSLSTVGLALVRGVSFAQGCEAGTAAVRTLGICPDDILPNPEESGRMPSWRRARAYFGTNNLRLIDEHLNSRAASIRVERLELTDVNPCFQALLVAHRLLPRIETFSVGTPDQVEPLIIISSEALEATMPVWELAALTFDRMPFSTFLPANFDARRKFETVGTAIRAAAWIAADDVLDAIDSSPDDWDAEVLLLIDARLKIVELAARQATQFIGIPVPRIGSVASSVAELRRWISQAKPSDANRVDAHDALVRLRLQWLAWGPVRRHPLIAEPARSEYSDLRLKLRRAPLPNAYRTI